MGNSNSGQAVLSPPPPPWTQSLPRDAHRQKKYGAIQGTKVLPERIPGQRLKTTENGRNLQVKGTITTRKTSDVSIIPPGYTSPALGNHHSTSMTALHYPPPRHSLQLHSNQIPATAFYPSPVSVANHKPRFGPPPSKSFTSEPDLRASPPSSHISLPIANNIPHTVISESPTKGKIKSKKRYKAPLPPAPIQASISLPLDYVPSPNTSMDNSLPSPGSKHSKSKSRKIGLFKKKSESRMVNYDKEHPLHLEVHSNMREPQHADQKGMKRNERSSTPVPIQISSRKELKERARSLDNLQHEIKRSPQGLAGSLHSLEIIDKAEKENQWVESSREVQRRSVSPEFRGTNAEKIKHSEGHEKKEKRSSSTLDRDSKGYRRMSTVERRLYEKQLEERRSEGILSSPVGDPRRFEVRQSRSSAEYHRPSSSCSSCRDPVPQEEIKDEWDLAEEEWLQKKKKLQELNNEIINVAKNLRKTSESSERIVENAAIHNNKENDIIPNHVSPLAVLELDNDSNPKTFFFGMEPEEAHKQSETMHNKSALAKLNEQEEVKIIGSTVEYSRHSLKPKEKKRNLERDGWNRSLDYRDKSHSRNREKEFEEKTSKSGIKKKLSREIDEFAATIERAKLKQRPSDEFSNSISRKGDGGYHSRQNSGSFHLEAEGSDEDIRMNLRPILPRRHLELPRFSPNAAWRSLSVEPTSRQKEVHSDIPITEEIFSIGEDQIHRYTRPVAPPRTSGEKSADSGISGDAGSPGPMQEFEPLSPEKIKPLSGPLAVSSPVISAKLDLKRAWTPAQDLDDNSLEETADQNGKGTFHQEISTIPKLTSRANMFSKPVLLDSPKEQTYKFSFDKKLKEIESALNEKETQNKVQYQNKDYQNHTKSLQRVREISSQLDSIFKKEDDRENDDNWRENWSMSRSIPNSLNNCDEPDWVSSSSKQGRSKSESRMPAINQAPDSKGYNPMAKQVNGGYFPSNSGHIMYLPEYKSYQVNRKESAQRMNNHISPKGGNECPSTPDQERKSPSGDENPGEPENGVWNGTEHLTFMPKVMILNGKKGKKFSYQSTVRMLEKKKLEEKLTKDAEEKEKRRKREVEAMMKVEQEFQKKREREKKRLKKQLQLFQQQQHQPGTSPSTLHNSSSEDNGFLNHSLTPERTSEPVDIIAHNSPPILSSSSPPPFGGSRQMNSYQSLPMEYINSPGYDSPIIGIPYQQHPSGFFSGIKKWVKGKKEHRSGYLSDASSVTVASNSRQDPDGAPAASLRKNTENIRAEIIAASRHRNGTTIMAEGVMVPPNLLPRHASPPPSVASKESHRRTATPDSRRAISPESRKSLSSETCPLTRELPEMKQEQRQYREYRRSRKVLMPPNIGHVKHNYKVSPVTHNYRRDFCLGNVLSPQTRSYPNDDSDRYSRHSNESRKSKQSLSKRNSSTDVISETDFIPSDSLQRRYSSPIAPKPSVPIPIPPHDSRISSHDANRGIRMPKSYHPPHIAPYNPSKGYRPVSFSPPSGKILSVT